MATRHIYQKITKPRWNHWCRTVLIYENYNKINGFCNAFYRFWKVLSHRDIVPNMDLLKNLCFHLVFLSWNQKCAKKRWFYCCFCVSEQSDTNDFIVVLLFFDKCGSPDPVRSRARAVPASVRSRAGPGRLINFGILA